MSPETAAVRARDYLAPPPCVGRVQLVLKPVMAIAGDTCWISRRTRRGVNGRRLARSLSADRGQRRPPAPAHGPGLVRDRARRALAGEHTRVATSWDSRYPGAVRVLAVRAVARPAWITE
jgi:type IV secretory pathway protease TraF